MSSPPTRSSTLALETLVSNALIYEGSVQNWVYEAAQSAPTHVLIDDTYQIFITLCRSFWGDVWGWLLEHLQHWHLVHRVEANDRVVQRALPNPRLQADGCAPIGIPRWNVWRSYRQGYLRLDSLRRRFRPKRDSNALRGSSCTRSQRRLHLHLLRRAAVAHAVLLEQRIWLDSFAPFGC